MAKRPTNSHLTVIDGRIFMWKGNCGACDASDIMGVVLHQRIWDDSCDVGFFVKSHKTGRKVLFTHTKDVHFKGELIKSVYTSYDSDREIRLYIYND